MSTGRRNRSESAIAHTWWGGHVNTPLGPRSDVQAIKTEKHTILLSRSSRSDQLLFKVYIANFTDYEGAYGTVGAGSPWIQVKRRCELQTASNP